MITRHGVGPVLHYVQSSLRLEQLIEETHKLHEYKPTGDGADSTLDHVDGHAGTAIVV